MPGEQITIDPAKYPNLSKIEDGEQVELKVTGTKSSDEDGMVIIETTGIEQTNVNPAKKSLKEMRKPGSPGSSLMQEEQPEPEGEDY